jgi:phosphatidylinositol alpha 1,6-mannosyltransferase
MGAADVPDGGDDVLLAGAVAAQRLDVPAVAVFQSDLVGFARRYRLGLAAPALWGWVRWIHRRAALTLAPSSVVAWELERRGITPVARWARGVDLERFNPVHRSELLRRHIAPRGEVVVGYVGRLAAEKQVRRLQEVAKVPGTRLVVVGDGPERPWLERHLRDAKFTGLLRGNDLAMAFASLDVFVHTGEHETFCQTVQEAQASGVPVVAPASGGPLDLVEHGRTGLLYDPSDRRSLRRSVATLVGSPDLRAELAERALGRVAQRSWADVVDDLVSTHYAEVTRPHRAAPSAA